MNREHSDEVIAGFKSCGFCLIRLFLSALGEPLHEGPQGVYAAVRKCAAHVRYLHEVVDTLLPAGFEEEYHGGFGGPVQVAHEVFRADIVSPRVEVVEQSECLLQGGAACILMATQVIQSASLGTECEYILIRYPEERRAERCGESHPVVRIVNGLKNGEELLYLLTHEEEPAAYDTEVYSVELERFFQCFDRLMCAEEDGNVAKLDGTLPVLVLVPYHILVFAYDFGNEGRNGTGLEPAALVRIRHLSSQPLGGIQEINSLPGGHLFGLSPELERDICGLIGPVGRHLNEIAEDPIYRLHEQVGAAEVLEDA